MDRLKGKVAIVTGGGQGIGKAIAIKYAEEGAKVAVADYNEETANATVQEITGKGGQALAVKMNVADSASVNEGVNKTKEWGGTVDVLVNNAGITADNRLVKMSEEEWDRVISINLKGVWLCGKAVAAIMTEQGSGSIINASSISGLTGNFGQSNYTAAKGGIIAMTKTWAIELGSKGVRVNAVAPGWTDTPMLSHVPEKVLESVKGKTPMRRIADSSEMAGVYLFFASDDSTFVTGQVISVDGGLTLGAV
jgi:3-oxoacyl-[acyl-carrier protein] reductase